MFFHGLAVYAFHSVSISFRLLVRSSPRNLTLHFSFISSIHLSTPRLPEILISIPQATFIPFSQKLFPTHFQWYIFIFCDELTPKTNILNFPHRPIVVAVISGNRVLLLVLAVGAFIQSPFRSGNYVRPSLRTPSLHFAFIRASTSAPRVISISFLTPYIPFPQSYPCHLPTHFQRLPSFLRRVSPKKERTSIFPHHPVVVAVSFQAIVFITCASGRCIHSISISLRELRSYLTPNPCTPFCLHSCIHLSTARHKYFFSHSIYSVPSVIPMPFSHPFPAVAFIPAASSPRKPISSRFPHHPVVVAVSFQAIVLITCASGRCIHSVSISLRELRSYLTPNPYTPLCLHSCIHLSTARHKYSFSHFTCSVPSVIPMPSSHPFPAVAFIPAAYLPQ